MPQKKVTPVYDAILRLPVPFKLPKGSSAFSEVKVAGPLAVLNLAENNGGPSLMSRRVFVIAAGAKVELECTQELELEVLSAQKGKHTTAAGQQVQLGGTLKVDGVATIGVRRFSPGLPGKTHVLEAVGGPVVLLGVTGGHDGVKKGGEKARLN